MTIPRNLQKGIGILIAALILFVGYYGTYLPMRKSRLFIATMQGLRNAKNLEEVQRALEAPLKAPSPIGQEELVRNSANVFQDILNKTEDPNAISQIMDFLDKYYAPIINRGRGMSFGQNVYILGVMNELAFIKTKQSRYFENAKFYYTKGHELGPERPQPLYGLFDLYRMERNVERSKEIANQILSQWPDDERVRSGLEEFLKNVGASKSAP